MDLGMDRGLLHGSEEQASTDIADESRARFYSKWTFGWLNPLIRLGAKRPLQQDDLGQLIPNDRGSSTHSNFQQKYKKYGSVWKACWYTHRAPMIGAGICKLLGDLFGFLPSLLLPKLLDSLGEGGYPANTTGFSHASPGMPASTDEFAMQSENNLGGLFLGYWICFGIFLATAAQSILLHQHHHQVIRVGMRIRSALQSAVFSKSLKLSRISKTKFSLGQIVNFQSVDAEKIMYMYWFLHYVWAAPLQILIAVILLYNQLGASSLAGTVVLLGIVPLQLWIGKRIQTLNKTIMGFSDRRLKYISEIVASMHVIKKYAWERSFLKVVNSIRDDELHSKRRSALYGAVNSVVLDAVPRLVSLVAFLVYGLTEENLTPAKAFTSITLFNILRSPVLVFPMLVNSYAAAKASVPRIEEFLCAEEGETRSIDTELPLSCAVELCDATVHWGHLPNEQSDEQPSSGQTSKPAVDSISAKFDMGSFVTIVGPVGSGKTALILSILHQLPCASGAIRVSGSIAYCPQEPFILNASVRENILFGEVFDDDRYRRVLNVCALRHDLEMLPAGDGTEIGERGITLSGGQKARVSIARAMYSSADILVLDDVLSAVDAHVGAHIMKHALLDFAKRRTRILASNQVQFFNKADKLLVLNNGKMVSFGPPEDALALAMDAGVNVSVDEKESTGATGAEPLEPATAVSEVCIEEAVDIAKKADGEGPKARSGGLMTTEERDVGAVKLSSYAHYIRSWGIPIAIAASVSLVLRSLTQVIGDWWLAEWSEDTGQHTTSTYVLVYGIISLLGVLAILWNELNFCTAGVRAGGLLGNNAFASLLRAPTSFFDTTPQGRILNRFSNDVEVVDLKLMPNFSNYAKILLSLVSMLALQATFYPLVLVGFVFAAVIYFFVQQFYRKSSRELKRLDNISKSPVAALTSETVNGISTIRAYGQEGHFMELFYGRVDENNRAFWKSNLVNRWLGVRLENIGALFVLATTVSCVVQRESTDTSLAGLVISYALWMVSILNWTVRYGTDTEAMLTSVERLTYYANQLPQEPPEVVTSHRPPSDWPSRGTIAMNNVVYAYRDDLEPTLKNVTISISAREKVGICGRTGAGKSTFVNLLFRMNDLKEGSVVIDNVDIGEIGLLDLRSHIGYIPQDSVLFSGTVRYNLDPFSEKSDDLLWDAIHKVGLNRQIESLDMKVEEKGDNFSAGQRQLICIARAIVKNCHILILDEATASIDMETDRLIQRMIRSLFKDCTVLTIAHRLHTIMDSEKVIVMNDGQIAEVGSPAELLRNTDGVFSALVANTGGAEAQRLRRMAFDAAHAKERG